MTSSKHLKNREGFTLIELIVVIVVIGILAATLLPQIMGAPSRARDTGRISELNSLSMALQAYYNDHGAFPTAAAGECLTTASTTGALLISGGYIQASDFPTDPSASSTNGGRCAGANAGKYYYKSLSKNGILNNAFLLQADVESDAKANAANTCYTSNTAELVQTCLTTGVGANTGIAAVYVKLGGI